MTAQAATRAEAGGGSHDCVVQVRWLDAPGVNSAARAHSLACLTPA